MKPLRTQIRRWASRLPEGVVILAILLLGLGFAGLVAAAIGLGLAQLLRLGGEERRIRVIECVLFATGLALVFPILFVFAYSIEMMEKLVGTRCPACGRREVEWRGGGWKYGDPPAYRYFEW